MKFELFAILDAEDRDAISSQLQESAHRAGSSIVRAGEENDDRVFLITSGEVSVLVEPRPGETQRVATLGPGMTFGEMALLGRRTRTATVRARHRREMLGAQGQ